MKLLIFDTETNGLPKYMKSYPNSTNILDWPVIVQLSYILYDTETCEVVTVQNEYIKMKDGLQITESSTKIHGITNEMCELHGVEMEHMIDIFMKDFNKADLAIAHNIEFDKKVLLAELYRCNKLEYVDTISFATKYFCTMQETIELCNIKACSKINKREFVKFPTLLELCRHLFGYEPKNLHNALNDVVICFHCFYKIRYDKDICDENEDIRKMIELLK
jgi:DNA polymerase-3 subunit epsilon